MFDFAETGSGYRYKIIEVNQCLRLGKIESDLMPLNESLTIMRTIEEVRRQMGLRYPYKAG